MLTGHALFRGTAGEVMYQHLHAPLMKGQLGQVPQPAVVLLEVLLEKNPARRFQNPAEMLTALAAGTGASRGGRDNTRPSVHQNSPVESFSPHPKPPPTHRPHKHTPPTFPHTPT